MASATTPTGEADVCGEYGKALYTLDTRADAGMDAGRLRAAQKWGTKRLYQQAAADAGALGKDTQWQMWVSHNAVITAETGFYSGEAPPPDTAVQRYRAAVVKPTAVGSDGWKQSVPQFTVFCTLRLENNLWRVDKVDF